MKFRPLEGLLVLGAALFASGFTLSAQESAQSQAEIPAGEPADTLSYPTYEDLDEVVVEGERPVMQTDGAKLTYNVDEDPAAASSNALDIIKKIPQLSVDADGNIRLNGADDYKLQVNGMENPMLKQYAGQILQAMPASSIVKVEVITEPGAKEDAEGSAGIINIITERTTQSSDGYSGTVSLQAGNRNLTPSLYGIVKKDKFTLSANINYQWGFGGQKSEQETTATYRGGVLPGVMQSTTGQDARHHYAGGNLNMSWEPNPSNLFTAGADLFYLDADLRSLYNRTSMFGVDGTRLWSFNQNGNGTLGLMNVSANASYRHTFGHEGNKLILSYLFNYGRTNISIFRRYDEFFQYLPEAECERQGSLQYNRGHTVQADYSNDFNTERHLLEVGAKGVFRHNTANNRYEEGATPDALSHLPDLDTYIIQPQDIYAAYASYTGTFGKFGVVGGLRYEHTRMGITDRNNPARNFINRLHDWVPNAALTWNFSPASNLRLAYQMRISRPSIEQVNPFTLSFSPYEIREGNPDLTSERNHIVSLKYSAFGRVVGGMIGLEYNLDNNAISGFTYLRQTDGANVIVTSYANIGKRQSGALTGFFNWNIIPRMNLTLNGRLAYNRLEAPSEGFRNSGWSGNIGANWNYTVADVYKFSAYGAWFSRRLDVQGYSTGFYYYGLSAARDFLADRSLTLSVSANNFLQKKMRYSGQTVTPDVVYDNNGWNLSAWNVGVSISWKFGSLKAKVKETGVELRNDDINSSSNKGQGSSI